MGLLDFNDPESVGAFGLLMTSLHNLANPKNQQNPFQAILAMDQMKNSKEDRAMNKEMRALQKQQLEAAIAEQQRTSAFRDNLMQNIGPLMAVVQPQQVPMQLPQLGDRQGTGDYRLNVETPEQQANLKRQLAYLQQNDPETHKQVLSALVKQGAISQPMQTIPGNPQAWQQLGQFGALGELAGVKGASGLVELAKLNAPDFANVDTGNGIQLYDKKNPNQTYFQKGLTPDQAITQARENAKAGYEWNYGGNPAAISPKQQADINAELAKKREANKEASSKLLPLLDEADKLLNTATGSTFGNYADSTAALFGKSTVGAQSAAQLKALEGQIMLAQPRMEGPQSDRDSMLYRQMAGQIGDPTVPVATRKAALEGIKKLHQQYAQPSASEQPQSGVRKYNPATGRIE